jgi:hypothetical protein
MVAPQANRKRKTMKKMLWIVLLLVLRAAAADVTGKWSGTFKVNGGDHPIPQIVTLKQDGNKLTGSAGPDPDEQYPIENGKVQADRVTFELTTGEWRFSYALKPSGQSGLSGNLTLKSVNNTRTAVVQLNRTK